MEMLQYYFEMLIKSAVLVARKIITASFQLGILRWQKKMRFYLFYKKSASFFLLLIQEVIQIYIQLAISCSAVNGIPVSN